VGNQRARRAAALLVLPTFAVQAATGTSAGAVDAQVREEAPLSASITANGTVARSYAWAVEKSADAAVRSTNAAGAATFTYTVTARAGAASESGWALSGSVTVTNPNSGEGGAITADVTVASDLGGGSACTVTGGNDVVVPPGQITLPYSCTFASAPAASGTVTATAAWDPAGEASSASATASAAAAFAVTSETNKTVAVVDDKTVPGQRVVLDPSVTWSTGLVKTYSYDQTVSGVAPGACLPFTNTASVDQPTGTDPSASATVRACAPEVLPAQAFGRAVGSVHATCRGTVRTRLSNRTSGPVVYTLRVGQQVHRLRVRSLKQKKFVTTGHALATVTLEVGSTRLDRIRIPQRCEAPVVLPDTGLRVGSS
jgi:hypothetical protein